MQDVLLSFQDVLKNIYNILDRCFQNHLNISTDY